MQVHISVVQFTVRRDLSLFDFSMAEPVSVKVFYAYTVVVRLSMMELSKIK